LESVKNIAEEINRSKARFEETEMVFEVAARFDQEYHDQIISPSRSFTRDIFMFATSQVERKYRDIPLQEIYIVILFSDLLIISSPRVHPFRNMDQFSRAKLISTRRAENQSKSVTDFSRTDHDLEFIRAANITEFSAHNEDGSLKICFSFHEGRKLSLFADSHDHLKDFMASLNTNQQNIEGKHTGVPIKVPERSKRHFFSRKLAKVIQ